MPTSAETWAVDTSVAVAALDATHAAHEPCRAALRMHRPCLSGSALKSRAAFETYSVLTRMPGQLAIDGPAAAAIISRVFPDIGWLDEHEASVFLSLLGPIGISGGAVYDALVGEAARTKCHRLLTRDQRARRTYDLLGVDYLLVE